MIIKDKNKLRLGAKSKILVLGLILVALVGVFIPTAKVSADCSDKEISTQAECEKLGFTWTSGGATANESRGCILMDRPNLQYLLKYATCIIGNSVIPLIFALALAMFTWGVVQFVINSDEEAKKAKGKQFMLWGIIALTVMVSVWGLVSILGRTFNINTNFIPQVKSPSP